MSYELTEIPRKKNSFGGEGGPYVIPPGAVHVGGDKRCETCGRMVRKDRGFPRKGSCRCKYYQRTTTFIDVIQDEFLLKQWGKRNAVWGTAQRPDIVLAAATCRPDSDDLQSDEDKKHLNDLAAEAQKVAGDKVKASVGTSLHRLTHQMDRGEELGYVPEPYPADLVAYQECVKAEGIEWVSVESFRVLDKWVKDIEECDHKLPAYGGSCYCRGVAGTVDRIGWYRGRLRIFDIKTGSDFNKQGHAMQLAMYGHMAPYQFPGDVRGADVDDIDLSVGYIIRLPAGKGECELVPYDLQKGWHACEVAKMVWDIRDDKGFILGDDPIGRITEMAGRAGSLKECNLLWRNAKDSGLLDKILKRVLYARADELKARGVTT